MKWINCFSYEKWLNDVPFNCGQSTPNNKLCRVQYFFNAYKWDFSAPYSLVLFINKSLQMKMDQWTCPVNINLILISYLEYCICEVFSLLLSCFCNHWPTLYFTGKQPRVLSQYFVPSDLCQSHFNSNSSYGFLRTAFNNFLNCLHILQCLEWSAASHIFD